MALRIFNSTNKHYIFTIKQLVVVEGGVVVVVEGVLGT